MLAGRKFEAAPATGCRIASPARADGAQVAMNSAKAPATSRAHHDASDERTPVAGDVRPLIMGKLSSVGQPVNSTPAFVEALHPCWKRDTSSPRSPTWADTLSLANEKRRKPCEEAAIPEARATKDQVESIPTTASSVRSLAKSRQHTAFQM